MIKFVMLKKIFIKPKKILKKYSSFNVLKGLINFRIYKKISNNNNNIDNYLNITYLRVNKMGHHHPK